MKYTRKERRCYPRTMFNENVEVNIQNGEDYQANTADISWSGMCLKGLAHIEGLDWLQARRLRHKPVTIKFLDRDITAKGTISRVDQKDQILGIRVSSTTNDSQWRTFCEHSEETPM